MSVEKVQFGVAKTIDEKIELITRGLDEVMGGDKALAELRSILEKRDLKLYWGTATTGAPHIAYFVPMSKIADFLRAGCEVCILFADLHAYLDNQKAPWDLLQARAEYYEVVIKAMLESIGVPLDKLKFVRGTEYQLSREFSLDMYKLTALTSERNSKKAGAEVVKQVASPFLSGMLYPLLQALDEEYLHVDAQFGGVDQRKIFTYAETFMPKIGYAKRLHFMNPMVPSFQGGKGNKMSASESNSKIDLLEPAADVLTKIKKAFAEPGNTEGNGLLAFTQRVLFPLSKDGSFTIERAEKHGGDMVFTSFADLEAAYASQALFPLDLKNAVAKAINTLLEPIRQHFETPELQDLIKRAYPAHVPEAEPVAEDDDDEAEPETAAAPVAADTTQQFYKLDLRVGTVTNVRDHPGADGLYLFDALLGAEPVQVVTNLKKSMAKEELEGKNLVFLCNLKPTSFRGEKSLAMIMGGTSAEGVHGLLAAPEGAKAGDRLSLQGQLPAEPVPARANEKVIAAVFGGMKTNAKQQFAWDGKLVSAAGKPVTMPGVAGAIFAAK